jgi:hypothetical protein
MLLPLLVGATSVTFVSVVTHSPEYGECEIMEA